MPDPAVFEALQHGRAAAARRVDASNQDVAVIISGAHETNGDDEHDPEGSTIGFERAQAQALADAALLQVAEFDAALSRLADGRYGSCERCGDRIDDERLEARPASRHCRGCAGRRQR